MSPGNRRIGTQQEKPSFAQGDDSYNATDANALCSRLARAPGGRERFGRGAGGHRLVAASRCRDWRWFLFAERDGLFEGRIAKMFMEPGDDPNPRCDRCEGDQKKAPFLGLAIINGMRRHGLEYEDGTILDPRNGTRCRALMHLSPDGQTLVVRGYLGIALLGQDQTWVRLPDSAYAELDPSVNPLAPRGSRPAASKRSQTRSPALR